MTLPETAIEAAAKRRVEVENSRFRHRLPWEKLTVYERDERMKDEAVSLTAFCESMGFEEDHTLRYEGWHKERPVTRLRSPWRPQ